MRIFSWTPLGRRNLLAAAELIGAVAVTSALLAIVDGAWFRPLPFVRPPELVQVSRARALDRVPTAAQMREMVEAMTGDPRILATTRVLEGSLSERYSYEPGGGTSLFNYAVSPEFFSVLGIAPALGRAFTQNEAEQPGLVPAVIGHTLWQSRWGGDRDIVGRVVQLGDTRVEIVGVMPPGFAFPSGTTLWTPLPPPAAAGSAPGQFLPSYVRLAEGVSPGDLALVYPRLDVVPFERMYRPEQHAAVTFLLAGSGVLLLCVILNLLSLRAVDLARRVRDAGIRQSLGATPTHLWQETGSHVVLLTCVSLAVSWLMIPALVQLVLGQLPPQTFRHLEVVYTWRTGAASILLAMTGALVYHWPASPGPRVVAERMPYGRGLWALATGSAFLVACGVALAYIAVLASTSAAQIGKAGRLGYEPDSVTTVTYPRRLTAAREGTSSLGERFLEVQDLPAVQAVALASGRPFQPSFLFFDAVVVGNAACERTSARLNYVTPDYFRALGISIVEGQLLGTSSETSEAAGPPRDTSSADGAGVGRSEARAGPFAPVVVNQALMRRWQACGATVGTLVQALTHRGTIVAVAHDTVDRDSRQPPEPQIYIPSLQAATSVLLVRHASDVDDGAHRRLVDELARMYPGAEVRRLSDDVADAHAADRSRAFALQVFCGLSVLLAAAGLLANQTALLDSRRREMALRLALGADLPHLRNRIVVPAVGGAVLGTPTGLLIGLACGRLGETLFVGVSAVHAPALVWVPVVAAAIAAGVSLFGARAVDRISPASVLKES